MSAGLANISLEAHGLTFSARVSGPTDGELVLLLHGFPDNADTFRSQMTVLGDAGYRCIAPTMRGYEPSSQPIDGDYSLMTLANDVVGWLDFLGSDRAHVVGHDWGAAVTYVLAAHHGQRVQSATTMAVPPLPRIPDALRHVPRQLALSWYMTFFQLPGVPEAAIQAGDATLLRWFWRKWSPATAMPDSVVASFRRPGVVASALEYYRQNATPQLLLGLHSNPATEIKAAGTPMLVLHGDQDGCMDARLFAHTVLAEDFPLGLRRETLAGVGHFLHREAPDQVNTLLLEWLGEHGSAGPA